MQSKATEPPLQQAIVPFSRRVLPSVQDATNTQNQVVANPATSDYTKVGLLDLSNELLCTIALHLCGSATIFDFSLVNKRLRSIAQDVMLRKPCVPKKGIRRVLEMLAVNPDVLQKIQHIDLCKYDCGHQNNCQCLGVLGLDALVERMFHGRIKHNFTHKVTWKQIQDAQRISTNRYNEAHSLFLDILVAFCPTLKELTIWLPPHEDITETRPQLWSSTPQHVAVVPIEGIALAVLQRCLQVLTIKSDPRYKLHAVHVIKLPGFQSLRSLTMPMEHLGSPNDINFYSPDGSLTESAQGGTSDPEAGRLTCLPLTLRDLQLTSCTRHTFVLLDVFNKLPPGQLRLKYITLTFDIPASLALILCAMGPPPECTSKKARTWVASLADMTSKGHHVDIYANTSLHVRKNGRKATFMEELQAMTKLPRREVAEIARAGMQFSDCVAWNHTGPRTRSLLAEHILFALHGTDYPALFSSHTFTATHWTDVAFFHGARGTKWGSGSKASLQFDQQQKAIQTVNDSPDRRKLKMRRSNAFIPGLRDLSSFAFSSSMSLNHTLSSPTLPRSVSFLGTAVSTPVASKPRREQYLSTSNRDVLCRASQSCLLFDSDAELRLDLSSHLSKFMEGEFNMEAWKWYLQPRVGAVVGHTKERRESRIKGPTNAHLKGKRQRQ